MKKALLSILIILIPSMCLAGDFSKSDKALFGTVVLFQVVDGLTIADMLSDGSTISNDWAWKYGTDRPSTSRMWGVKALELGIGYVVARNLPPAWRKGFFIAVDVLLL